MCGAVVGADFLVQMDRSMARDYFSWLSTKRGGRAAVFLVFGGLLLLDLFLVREGRGVPCLFLSLTGARCPGCGLQRAGQAFLRGDLLGAIRYNYALIVMVPLLLLYLYNAFFGARTPRLRAILLSPYIVSLLMGFVILWWILRNVLGC